MFQGLHTKFVLQAAQRQLLQTGVPGLRLLKETKQIAAGLASLDRGQAEPGEKVFDELESDLSSRPQESR